MRFMIPFLLLAFTACASSFQPTLIAPGAFTFTLTPEQCLELNRERRTFRATEQAALYVSGAGSLVAVLALALSDSDTAPAISAGASLAAGATSAFAGTQVSELDEELAVGGCPR